jgi:hypothetical protein
MIATIKIGRLKINLVLRHRFETRNRLDMTFRRWELGLWFRKNLVVGSHEFKNPSRWSNNLVGSYMFGVELLICKAWLEVNYGAMTFDLPTKKICKCNGTGECKCNK